MFSEKKSHKKSVKKKENSKVIDSYISYLECIFVSILHILIDHSK